MSQAIRVHQAGDAKALQWDNIELGKPGVGEVKLRQTACGLNYIDVYMRDGVYPIAEYPSILGMEAAGVVEELGEDVAEMGLDLNVGDRVAYAMVAGAYAEERLIDALKLIKIPDSIDDKTAATMMLKGLTAHYLLFRSYPVKADDTILVQAAAGGVGLMLCQWAKHLGVNVIGTVGSQEKAALAMENGCDHTILYREENISERVRELTDGVGVAAVYDGIGQSTFEASLDSLQPFGVMVTFGNITGQVEPFSPKILAPKGSLYVTRPTLGTHTATRELLVEGADRLIDVVSKGIVKNYINQSYALKDTTQAHQELEARTTTGSTVLIC